GDEADAILLLDVVRGQRARRLDGEVERAAGAVPGLGEGVEEDDDVGVPLGMRLVHPRLAAARGRAPVDATDAVAGDERAQVGELDPVAAHARGLAAGERLGLERPPAALPLPPR